MTGRKAFLSNTAWKAAGSTPCWSNPEQLMVKGSALPVESGDSVREGLHGQGWGLGRVSAQWEHRRHGRSICAPPSWAGNMGWAGRQMVEVDEVSWVRAPSLIPLILSPCKTYPKVYANSALTTAFQCPAMFLTISPPTFPPPGNVLPLLISVLEPSGWCASDKFCDHGSLSPYITKV